MDYDDNSIVELEEIIKTLDASLASLHTLRKKVDGHHVEWNDTVKLLADWLIEWENEFTRTCPSCTWGEYIIDRLLQCKEIK